MPEGDERPHGEIVFSTHVHGKVLSTALGVNLATVLRVNDFIVSLNETNDPFAGAVAFQYVEGLKAILGFTRFPNTCAIAWNSDT